MTPWRRKSAGSPDALSLEATQIRDRVRSQLFGSKPDTLRYEIRRKLGAGGEGVVYAAYDPILDCEVALKQFHTRRTHDSAVLDRLRQEARLLARLRRQPHIVTLYDFFSQDDQDFVVMELVPGSSLRRWQAAPHTWDEILAVYAQAGQGLAAAHEVGIVHRDFKPDNVLIDGHGTAKVADFGIASVPGTTVSDLAHEPREHHSDDTTSADHPGTRRYMAPEQSDAGLAGPNSDQYSFCVALYEALYGDHPTLQPGASTSAPTTLGRDVRPPPRSSSVPRHIFRVLKRGLSVHTAERYPSMHALLVDLHRRPARRNALLALATATVATITAWSLQPPPTLDDHIGTARAALDERLQLPDLRRNLDRHVSPGDAGHLTARVDEHAARVASAVGRLHHDDQRGVGDDTRKRLECLELTSDGLTGFASTLRTATVIDLASAAEALNELADPSDCLTLPAAPLRCRVDEVNDRRRPDAAPVLTALEAAERHEIAGDWPAAIAAAAAAADHAERLADAAILQTRAHYAHGRLLQLAERPEEALTALAHARQRVEARECLDMRTDIAGRMVKITAQNPSTPLAPALDWSRSQQNLAETLRDDRRIAQAHSDRGLLSVLRGGEPELQHEDPDLALRELTTAQTIRDERLGGRFASDQADTLLNLSTLHRTRGDLVQARRAIESAVQQRSRAYGADHTLLYRDLRALALLESDEGNGPAALATLTRALDLARRGYQEASAPYIKVLFDRLAVETAHDHLPAAMKTAVRLGELAPFGAMDPVFRHLVLTGCASLLGQHDHLPEARKILDAIPPSTPRMLIDRPTVAFGLAEASYNTERWALAETFATRALLGFQARAAGELDADVTATLLLRANLRLYAERYDAALEDLEPLLAAPAETRQSACEIYRTFPPQSQTDNVLRVKFAGACG